MLADNIDHALKRASDLQPLQAMLQPIMSALIQCFQQEDAHVNAAQPASGQPSAQLTAMAGIINLITIQVLVCVPASAAVGQELAVDTCTGRKLGATSATSTDVQVECPSAVHLSPSVGTASCVYTDDTGVMRRRQVSFMPAWRTQSRSQATLFCHRLLRS